MPRTKNPNEVIDAFQDFLQESRDSWDALIDATTHEQLRKRVCVDTFLHVAVGFEEFRSDWHLACINRDPTVFRAALRSSVAGTLKGSRYRGVGSHMELTLARFPSLRVIKDIVDPGGHNIAFPTVDDWLRRTHEELAPRFSNAVDSLSADDRHVVRAIVSIRNCIAHRSSNSVAEMNKALAILPAGLRRGSHLVRAAGLGSYLWATRIQGGPARVWTYMSRLRAVVEQLRTA